MAQASNHWKLGLFVVTGIGAAMAVVVLLGARSLHKETVTYTTYFDESVQGLDIGSPLKFRGVTIGNVANIDVADDRRHVEVTLAATVSELNRLGLNTSEADRRRGMARIEVPPDLRAQLGSSGLTGVKFIQIDFFDVKDNPPPVLPFEVPENYIPAASSTMKNLEDAITHALNRLPELADQMTHLLGQVNTLLQDVDDKKLPDKAVDTLERANRLLAAIQGAVKDIDMAKLSKQSQRALGSLNKTVTSVNSVLDRVDGQRGLISSAQRATDSVGDFAGSARDIGSELESTLREVREAASSLARLTDAMEQDSDMLIKGRSSAKKGMP
jgi:phospholipid/cholesterol/gamma-HCH transport system substrate-binding protein